MQELIQGGLSNLCRLCGEDERECFDLFDDERKEEELLFKIEQSIRIAITQGDGLPSGICTVCHDKLTGYASFYQLCHDTQNKLQEFLSIECAMQKSIQCNQEQETTNDDDDVDQNYGGDMEDVYYYEDAPDEDMEAVQGEESYVITEVHEDAAEQSSFAASEPEKMLPLRDLSPEQKEDSKQSCVEHLTLKKRCLTKNNLISSTVPFYKSIDNAKLNVVGKTTSEERTHQNHTPIQVSTPVVLEPPPLVKITPVTQKKEPPLVSIVKQFPQVAPPLVPIQKSSSREKGSSNTSNSLPTPYLVPISRPGTAILKSEAVKSKLAAGTPCLVPISMLKPESKKLISSGSNNPKRLSSSESVLKFKNLCKEPENSLRPQEKGANSISECSQPKPKGRAFIMTEDKTVALEVDIVNENNEPSQGKVGASKSIGEPVSYLRLRNIDLVPSNDVKSTSKKVQKTVVKQKKSEPTRAEICAPKVPKIPKVDLVPVPYLKLKNGDLIPMDLVEKIPLNDIPVPPVILMCYSDKNLPEVCVKESMTFSESSTSPAKLSSGLYVSNYPAGLPSPVNVLPNPSTDTRKADIFVLRNSSQPSKKKKIFTVRTRRSRKGCIMKACPEVTSQVEILSTDPRQFRCRVCGVTLSNKKRCEYHVVSKHFAERCNFECRECGKKFPTNFFRTQHIKLKHTRPPEYICSMCGAKFRTLPVLRGHELRHTSQDPPFKCDACGKGFYTKANCSKHFTDVHMEKTAVCDICGESFAGVGRLNEHRSNHLGGFKCAECGKTFNSKSRLRAHKVIHSTAEPLYCNCGKKFVTFAFLHNHSKVCQEGVNTVHPPEEVPSTSNRIEPYKYYAGEETESDTESTN